MAKRGSSSLPVRRRLLAAALAACFVDAVHAMPTGPQVAGGAASFSQNGSTLTIDNSNNAILNWQSFNIAAGESVRFNQPSTASSVLNRVLGGDPSQIFGQLGSNGRVWLVNPAGILVGAGARIDTAGFVASTLNVRNEDFLAGRLSFQSTPGAGSLVNRGTIATPAGGSVYLVAPNVVNEGIITTPQGEAILAAGQTVELIDTATPGVKVEVTGATGNVTNLGSVVAEAGRVGMVGVLVKNSGNLNASSVVREGGRIFLKARQDAYVDGNAHVAATGSKGGRVEVLGNRVAVADNAQIDASGQNGGGTVLVGGDAHGANPQIANASATFFGKDAVIKADAWQAGDGGKVVVWANETTRAHGSISAQGAPDGRGGFVETSGHHLDTAGIRLKLGAGGRWLLDPFDMTIGSVDANVSGSPNFVPTANGSSVAAATINALLDAGTSVTVDTSGAGADVGDITVNTAITKANGADATLTLLAHDDIFVNADITSTVNKLNVIMRADQAGAAPSGGIFVANAKSVVTNGGDFTASAKTFTLNGTVNAGSGKAWIYPSQANWSVDLGAKTGLANTLELSTAELNSIAAAGLRIGAMNAGNLNISAAIAPTNTTTLTLESGGIITQAPAGTISVNSLALKALGGVTLDLAPSMVTNLAGQVGDASHQNNNFKFKNSQPLNIASVDGVAGVNINISGGYNAGTPDGVIALLSSGALTQSAGATLGGKAVYAEGSRVALTNANSTGVIAGKATGTATPDTFSYASSNGIAITTVYGFSGVQSASATASIGVDLSAGSAGINQISSAPITSGGGSTGLRVATSGPVNLMSTSNNIGWFTTSGSVGQLGLRNSGALTLDTVSTSNASIDIGAAGLLAVKGNIGSGSSYIGLTAPNIQLGVTAVPGVTLSGNGIKLQANSAGGTISTAGTTGSTLTSSGGIALSADNLSFPVAPTFNATKEINYRTYTDNRSITVGTACNAADPSCLVVGGATNNAADLIIGNEVVTDTDTAGNIHVDAAISNPSGRVALLSGGNVSQTAAITAAGLGASAGGTVSLTAGNAVGNVVGKSGGGFSLTSSQNITVTSMTGSAPAPTINGITAGGPLLLQTSGNITLNAPVTSSAASGNAVVLAAGGSFVNGAGGAITLSGASSPRWLVYAANPASVTKNGLTSAFRHYSATYSTYPTPSETGNGIIYAAAPGTLVVDTSLASGSASNTYGVAPTAAYTYSYANAASADAEDLAQIVGTPAYTPAITATTAAGAYTVSYGGGLSSGAGYGFTTGTGVAYTVNPAPLTLVTVGLTGSTSKTYDGTTVATLTPANYALSGFVKGDDATVTQTSGTYASKNVGSGILVTASLASSDYTPVGTTNLANYVLPTSASGNIGTITPATLTISGVTANDKVYDATTLATLNTGAATLRGVLAGEVVGVAGGSGSFADKNVGTAKPVTGNTITLNGADCGNYVVASPSGLSASITPATIASVDGIAAADKVYDGTLKAGLDATQARFSGMLAGDQLTVGSASGSFADKNVGSAKPVTIAGITLAGADAGNYVLAKDGAAATASITPATIASVDGIAVADKVYDGSVSAVLDKTKASFNGMVSGDALLVGDASGAFGDAEIGTGKTVAITGITLAGADAGNYILARDTATASASITAPTAAVSETSPVQSSINQVVSSVNTTTQQAQPETTATVLPASSTTAVATLAPSSLAPQTIGGSAGEFGGTPATTAAPSSAAPATGSAPASTSAAAPDTAGSSTTANTAGGTADRESGPEQKGKKDKKDDGSGEAAKKPAAEKPAARKLPLCS